MIAVYSALLIAFAVALYAYRYGRIVSPDGGCYLLAASGNRPPAPFNRRLFPLLFWPWARCYASAMRSAVNIGGWQGIGRVSLGLVNVWTALSYACIVGSGALLSVYAEQRGANPLLAVALWAGLPWVRLCVRMPVLTDQAGMAVALGAGCCSSPAALVVLGLVAGLVSERMPVFAALFAWSPWPLVGLAVPAAVALFSKPGAPLPWHHGILERPFASARERHNAAPLWVLVAPWGAAVAGLAGISWQMAATLAVAYGQVAIATDRVRLYQTAAPVLCVAAAESLAGWSPLAVAVVMLVHWFGPQSEERG